MRNETYTYGNSTWKDQLTAYDGQTITYDGSGNPLSYYNGRRHTFTWQNGRQLASTAVAGTTVSYTYDGNGLRTGKNVNGTVHNYLYAGDRLVRETYGDNTLDFYYDHNGRPYALDYNGTLYYYILNLQGDVMALVDENGTEAAAYRYDPYGRVIYRSSDLAFVNPLQYRGYYYDLETGFYYLQSRYYDPQIRRFINADAYASTGQGILGCNMYAYCNNNPVFCKDPRGSAMQATETCLGGSGGTGEKIVGMSDGKGYSDDLLKLIMSEYVDESIFGTGTPGTILISVVKCDESFRVNPKSEFENSFETYAAPVLFVAGIPKIGIPEPVGMFCWAIDALYALHTLAKSAKQYGLTYGDYEKYRVTISCRSEVIPDTYPFLLLVTDYRIEMTFAYDARYWDNRTFVQLGKGSYSANTMEYFIY